MTTNTYPTLSYGVKRPALATDPTDDQDTLWDAFCAKYPCTPRMVHDIIEQKFLDDEWDPAYLAADGYLDLDKWMGPDYPDMAKDYYEYANARPSPR